MLVNIATTAMALAALIVSILSYRHAQSVKVMDLRLEANKAREDIQQKLDKLKQSHARALDARKAINAARGLLNSGGTQKYEQAWNSNRQRISMIEIEFANYAKLISETKTKHLEQMLVALHKIMVQIETLQAEYNDDAAYNVQQQAELRADQRSRT